MSTAHPFRRFGRRMVVGATVCTILTTVAISASFAAQMVTPPVVMDDPGLWGVWQKVGRTNTLGMAGIGVAVEGEGDTALVGEGGDREPGQVSVFGRSGSLWSQEASLSASDGATGDGFGKAIALSGTMAIVGAPQRGSTDQGAAYVFTRSGSTWAETAILQGTIDSAFAGSSVDIEGDTALVGAPSGSGDSGRVWVFQRVAGTWSRVATLTPPASAPNDRFGASVRVRGSDVFVGAPTPVGLGSVHVYTGAGGSWSHVATLTVPGEAAGHALGASVAVWGDRLIAGAPHEASDKKGVAYIFERTASAWSLIATLSPPPGDFATLFGCSVAMSGSKAVVGAPKVAYRGAAFAYAGPSWSRIATLTAPDPAATLYGTAVALWGDTVLVGEPLGGGYRGAAYFLHTPVYSTQENVALTVPTAEGVLTNDRSPRGYMSLVATQATTPGHGTVALASDGGFVYTPELGFAGVDTFTYKAYDGRNLSAAPAVVSITVTPGTMQVPVSPYAVRRGRVIQVYGVAPHRHRPGTFPVVLDCYRLEGGEWVWRKAVKMKAYAYPRRTKYGRWLTLPSKGRWRLIARDTEGDVTRYSTPRYMRVW
jgi:hypothetical protein